VLRRDKKLKCGYHCSEITGGCGSHFTSLKAFDLHRKDGECLNPNSINKLKYKVSECDISSNSHLKNIKLWSLIMNDQQKEYFERKNL